jgi:hypothetical protein
MRLVYNDGISSGGCGRCGGSDVRGYAGFGDSDPANDLNAATNTLMSQVEDLYSTALQAALASNVEAGDPVNTIQHSIRNSIDDWNSTRYNWASGDHGPNGTYDWARWFEDGRQIGMAVQDLAKSLQDQNVFSQIGIMLAGMAETTNQGLQAFARLAQKTGAGLQATASLLPVIAILGVAAFAFAKGRG